MAANNPNNLALQVFINTNQLPIIGNTNYFSQASNQFAFIATNKPHLLISLLQALIKDRESGYINLSTIFNYIDNCRGILIKQEIFNNIVDYLISQFSLNELLIGLTISTEPLIKQEVITILCNRHSPKQILTSLNEIYDLQSHEKWQYCGIQLLLESLSFKPYAEIVANWGSNFSQMKPENLLDSILVRINYQSFKQNFHHFSAQQKLDILCSSLHHPNFNKSVSELLLLPENHNDIADVFTGKNSDGLTLIQYCLLFSPLSFNSLIKTIEINCKPKQIRKLLQASALFAYPDYDNLDDEKKATLLLTPLELIWQSTMNYITKHRNTSQEYFDRIYKKQLTHLVEVIYTYDPLLLARLIKESKSYPVVVPAIFMAATNDNRLLHIMIKLLSADEWKSLLKSAITTEHLALLLSDQKTLRTLMLLLHTFCNADDITDFLAKPEIAMILYTLAESKKEYATSCFKQLTQSMMIYLNDKQIEKFFLPQYSPEGHTLITIAIRTNIAAMPTVLDILIRLPIPTQHKILAISYDGTTIREILCEVANHESEIATCVNNYLTDLDTPLHKKNFTTKATAIHPRTYSHNCKRPDFFDTGAALDTDSTSDIQLNKSTR